jgi:hypothetical protein
MLETFMKNQGSQSFVKIRQKYRAICMDTTVDLMVAGDIKAL